MTDLINTRNVRQDSLPLSGKYGPPKNDKVILIVVLGIINVLKRVYCDCDGARTHDPRLKRAVLYQLSYAVIYCL